MKEIGGYFGMEEMPGSEYYPEFIAVNNARNALLYLLRARGIKKLYIPFFLCDSVSLLLDREGYAYEYYHIDHAFQLVLNTVLAEDEYLYIVNYYGQISNEQILRLQQEYGRIIVDNVQAFFQKPVKGIDTVYSCRKFFGVPDGGYVSTDARLAETLETDVSADRMKHVLGRYEGCASDYHADFKTNDSAFKELPLKAMSRLTHNLLCAVNYSRVKSSREENFAVLDEALGRHNRLKIVRPEGPYAYPFYCKDGMEIKKKLAAEKIYVATLWPNVLNMEGVWEREYAENILPLPCDQRYTREDMLFVAQTLLNLL